MSISKINFLKVRKSLQNNPILSIQIPPNTSWDPKSFGSSNRITIIGETPNRYITIDPYDFDNMSNQFESSNDKEIIELDRIPCYVRSIQQVLSNRHKLEYFLMHNTPLLIDVLTSYDLIKGQSTATESKDSLFTYEHVEPSKDNAPT